jgi:cytoskeletal protein RodZ
MKSMYRLFIIFLALFSCLASSASVRAQAPQPPSDAAQSDSGAAKKTAAPKESPKPGTPPAASPSPSTPPNAPNDAASAAKPAASQKVPPATNAVTVWVNTTTGIYHKSGSHWYGKTKQGKYMTEADAIKAGYRAASKN